MSIAKTVDSNQYNAKDNRDYNRLKSEIDIISFLEANLPGGKIKGKEYVVLNPTRADNKPGSFTINIDTGIWKDFSCGDGGSDMISLYAYIHTCPQSKAYDELSGFRAPAVKLLPPTKKEVKFIAPESAPQPSFNIFGENQGVWEYRSFDDKLLGYMVRKKRGRGKSYVPWSFQGNKWIIGWYESEFKSVYRCEELKKHPNKPVLLVEGEKTADAAAMLFSDYVVISWMFGSDSAKYIDCAHLKGRTIFLWPDNDEPGYKAEKDLSFLLTPIAGQFYCIDPKPLGVPEKWDLADLDLDKGNIDWNCILRAIEESKKTKKPFQLLPKDEFPDLSSKGNPINTSDNIICLLKFYGIELRYNLMTNYPEFIAPNKKFSTVNEADCFFTEISNLCVKTGVPKVDLAQHILYIADKNRYHPAIEFIQSKKWDGRSRIAEFLDTVTAENPVMARKLIYRWLIGCVAAAYSDKGISLEGVLVFQGPQKIGKTHWFINLVPNEYQDLARDSLHIDPNDKDSVMICTGCWLGEVAEIDGTINKSSSAALKQFLTRSSDIYRVPFGRIARAVPRKTSFFGSVNSLQFLSDDTGNRRYWTIAVESINHDHNINMQQLWAEIKIKYDEGESYRLTDEEQNMIEEANENHMPIDPIEETIYKRYHWDDDKSFHTHSMTATEVLLEIGFSLVESRRGGAAKKTGAILTKLTGKKGRKTNGKLVFNLPRLKSYQGTTG